MGNKYLMYNNQLWELSQKFEFTGSLQEFTLEPDTYLFVANGARGGRQPTDGKNRNEFISWGGTTYGILDLDHTQTFYAAVGGEGGNSAGSTVKTVGGYNGGGSGGASAATGTINGAGGGGATDVRLSNVENTYEEEPVYAPHGYDQLEFLSSWVGDPAGYVQDGNYIDTGYLIKSNSKIELVIEVDPEGETGPGRIYGGPIFGAGSTGRYFPQSVSTAVIDQGGSGVYFFEDNTQYSAYIDMNKYEWGTPEWTHAADNRYIHGFGKIKFTLNGNTLRYESEDGTIDYTLYPETRVNCEFPMYIFSVDVGGNPVEQGSGMYSGLPEIAQMRFYYMKIWEGDQLVHWYVPIALATDDGHISVLPDETTFTEEQRRIMRNRGIFDLVERKPYFGVLKESTNIPNPYYGIGPHRDPIDQDYYSTRTVQKINGASSRILVAGGGGGSSVMHDTNNTPDYYSFGGGFLAGCISGPSVNISNYATLRATQESGYSFGAGADADDRSGTASSGVSYGNTGNGGGGGGWYGGYAIASGSTASAYSGGYGGTGGSSYVLTASSYKPAGYMADYADIMESLYFRNTLMLPYQAFEGASLEIYKLATSKPLAGDTVVAPFVGYWQHADLLPSQYRIKCYGGDGGTRTYNSVASKGGYAEGVLNLPDTRSLFFHVGASSFLVGTKTTPAERTEMFAKALYYQTKNLGNSAAGTELLATQPGGSVDVRTEQTGNVEKLITIPDEYDELEYLETDGTQRIQFTWYQSSQYVQYEIVCNLTDTGAQQCLFGVMSGTTTRIGIFPVYDPLDPQLTFMNKNEFACDGSQMPFGSKITLKIIDTHMSWYDAAGTKLGEITTTKARQGQMGYPIYLFDCNNVGSPLNANTVGKLYSFKVTEVKPNETKIQHWYLPCVSKSDPNNVGLYDFVTRTFITRYNTATMHPFTAGPIIQEKSALRVVVDNTNISRYSRFIVAGGGGGQGSPIGLGGDGGGLEGEMCKGTATDSTVVNVGRQDGGMFFEFSTGGGKYQSTAYLGAGGWGWYAGYSAKNGTSSSQPAASTSDINKGGSGGSGYVLTADSYKPTISNWTYDDRFYLSDTVLTTGGNPVRGMTKIVMDVLDSSAAKLSIIAGDGESYKAYDISNNTWWSITGVTTLTPEVFDEFGVPLQSILSDEGLTFPYRLYLCDPFNSGANKIWTYVIPQTQHVSFTHQCAIREVNNYVLDDELDESISASLQYETTDQGISTDISVTMNDVPTKDSYVYMVQYNVDKLSTTDTFKPQEISKSGKEVVLYSTAKNKIASAYKDYPNTLMPDGKTIITSVENTSSCEYQRKIYTVSSINGQVFRITEYDMATDSFSIIRDNIPKSWVSGSGATGGSLLIKDNVAYLFNSFIFNPSLAPGDLIIATIPFSQSETITQYLSRNIPNADLSCRSTCYGQTYWYSETETISCAVNGFITFDINSHEMTHHPDSVNAGDTGATSFALGKYTIIKCIYDANGTTTVHVFNRETLLGVPGYTMEFPNGTRCVCYDNNRFYIAQPGLLYIFQDQANCKPTLISTITIPNATLQPKTIDCSNGCVYITFDNSDSMYVYTISLQRWSIVELPFTVPTSAITGWLRPATFGGYVFIGNLGMFVANANIGGKYGIGERNSFIHIFPNESYANNMTYNDRFITPDEKGLHIHMGYIDKNLSPIALDSCIYQTQEYVSTDYKRMFHHSFRQGE